MVELATKEEIAHAQLPPAGHERQEVLKKRTDDLEQKGEEQYANAGSIPAELLQPDHNVQNVIRRSYLDIGIDHPLYKTKWVNYINQNGMMVWQAKADGWCVATAKEFLEAKDMTKEDGTIRVGDVMLMFIRHDEYLKLDQRETAKRLRQQFGVEAEIHSIAAKYPDVFTGVQTPEVGGGVSESTLKTMESRAASRKTAVQQVARHLGNKMKSGTIPGVPIK